VVTRRDGGSQQERDENAGRPAMSIRPDRQRRCRMVEPWRGWPLPRPSMGIGCHRRLATPCGRSTSRAPRMDARRPAPPPRREPASPRLARPVTRTPPQTLEPGGPRSRGVEVTDDDVGDARPEAAVRRRRPPARAAPRAGQRYPAGLRAARRAGSRRPRRTPTMTTPERCPSRDQLRRCWGRRPPVTPFAGTNRIRFRGSAVLRRTLSAARALPCPVCGCDGHRTPSRPAGRC
jgi:hypothetical protein